MTLSRRFSKPERPRPLKLSTIAGDNCVENVLSEMDFVSHCLTNNMSHSSFNTTLISLCDNLKTYGSQLETNYKDQLDRCYVSLRNGCRDDALPNPTRFRLLEIIELRAMKWQTNDTHNSYYRKRCLMESSNAEQTNLNEQLTQDTYSSNMNITRTNQMSPSIIPASNVYSNNSSIPLHSNLVFRQVTSPVALLSPGELLKSSGKFAKPARVPGKNLCKDEIVIRNLDSGKVNPGARERLVQITGPAEENLRHASHLMEDTIRRNASPIREEQNGSFSNMGRGSPSSSHASEDAFPKYFNTAGTANQIRSTNKFEDPIGEYRYTVSHGNDSIRITGTNLEFVERAKLLLEDYFGNEHDFNNGAIVNCDVDDTISCSPPSPPIKSSFPATEHHSVNNIQRNGVSVSASIVTNDDRPEKQNLILMTIRTPLIPTSSKIDFINAETDDRCIVQESKMRRLLFCDTSKKPKQQNSLDEGSPSSDSCRQSPEPTRIIYSRQLIITCADSHFSHRTPPNWATVIRTFPVIVKKSAHHLATLIATMNDMGDSCMNNTDSYLPDSDLYFSTQFFQNDDRKWTICRKSSIKEEDENGN